MKKYIVDNLANQTITGDIDLTGNLEINGGIVGGTNGLDNITITINTISSTPSVYEPYQCTIFKNSSANNRLSYYDDDDVLTIKGITE